MTVISSTHRSARSAGMTLARHGFSPRGIGRVLEDARDDGAAGIDNGKLIGFVGATVEYEAGTYKIEVERGYLADGGRVIDVLSGQLPLFGAGQPAPAVQLDLLEQAPAWVAVCDHPRCVLTMPHAHGAPDGI